MSDQRQGNVPLPIQRFEEFLSRLFRVSKQELDDALEAEKRIVKPREPEDEVTE